MFLGQPVKQVSWVARQNLIIMECGDGLDTLLQLLQTRLHALHLEMFINICHTSLSHLAHRYTSTYATKINI